MKVDGKPTRTIWLEADGSTVGVIDQTRLPHRFVTLRLATLAEAVHAIAAMQVRGAPLIGAAAAYGAAPPPRADPPDGPRGRPWAARTAPPPPAVNLKGAREERPAGGRN